MIIIVIIHNYRFSSFSPFPRFPDNLSSSQQMFFSNGFNTMHVVCTDLLCAVCIGLLSVEFSTVNTRLGRSMFWKPKPVGGP